MTAGFDPDEPERFRRLIEANLGLAFDDGRLGTLTELLRQRAEANRLSVGAYLLRMESGDFQREMESLAETLTVGETYFFRNRDQFTAFTEVVLPDRCRARGPAGPLNFLSAGCSSGDEAYTLAIILREAAIRAPRPVSIRAVDVNPAAVARAERGRFTSWSLRDTPADTQSQWFVPEGKELVLKEEIRSAVNFEQRNLKSDDGDLWKPSHYDAIFCRNVIMYLTTAVQKQIIERIARSLVPGGYLFLGHAETLRGLTQDFHLVHTHGTFYYQRRRPGDEIRPPGHDWIASTGGHIPWTAAPSLQAAADTSWFDEIGNATRRIEALTRTTAETPPPFVAAPAPWSLGLALDLLQRERFTEALDHVQGLPAEAREDPDVLLLRATLLVHGGKLAAATEVCRALLLRDELNAGANYVLGLCFDGAGDQAGAAHHYSLASYLDPNFAMPLLHLGRISRRSGDISTARSQLEQALGLLKLEDASRLLLFGGGFTRDGLIKLGEAELRACTARS